MQTSFFPLLFGGDINVYSVARAFHEAYGVRSTCYGKYPSGPAYDSAIIDYRVCAQNEEPEVFCANVAEFAAAHGDAAVLVLGCGDSYVKLAAKFRDSFPPNVIAPYAGGALIDSLIHKERFYKLCDEHGLAYPDTFVYRREMGRDFTLPFPPPYICKPSDGVAYWLCPFPGNEKVFKCADRASLDAVLDRVYAAGYADSMIIQDFIPGDDSYMRVLTNYSDRGRKVKLMCLGHVLLEEHTPHGVGNHAVIVTEHEPELCETFRAFLDGIGYTGFSNFDLKYDRRDGRYKVFEINCRQGRSNYYVTGAGYNIARFLVEDRVEGKDLPYAVCKTRSLWRVVPRSVAFRYIPRKYHTSMRELIRAGGEVNPLFYAADRGLLRLLRLTKNQAGHFLKYRKYLARPRG